VARTERALISVSDKTGIVEFARTLGALGIEMIATGGTARLLKEGGVDVVDVAEYTGFPDILNGFVRTLHPKIHAGVLAQRHDESHLEQMQQLGIRLIDMVVVNLYGLVDVITESGTESIPSVESIDIAGPSLIRSAAKNYTHVAAVTNPEKYDAVALELQQNDCELSEDTHFALALEAFRHTAHYDTLVAEYLTSLEGES